MVELRPQNRTLTGALPRDRPSASRAHRVYVATTNHCNRACPWCSTCSSPRGRTWISISDYRASFPSEGPFEVQLEGGEPTIHPEFFALVQLARADPRCVRVVVVSNSVVVPREREALQSWLARLGAPLTFKLSINHHLLARDRGLLERALEALRPLAPTIVAGSGSSPCSIRSVKIEILHFKSRSSDITIMSRSGAIAGLTWSSRRPTSRSSSGPSGAWPASWCVDASVAHVDVILATTAAHNRAAEADETVSSSIKKLHIIEDPMILIYA